MFQMESYVLWLFVATLMTVVADTPAQYPPVAGPAPGDTYNPYPSPDSGFGLQAGYEGYLVPVENSLPSIPWPFLPPPLLSVLPKVGLKLAGRIGTWLLGFAFVVLVGGGFTVAVCTFTPICTLTFLGFGFGRDSVRDSMRSYLTPDRLSAATAFVMDAIEKYSKMQVKEGKSLNKKVKTEKIDLDHKTANKI